MAKDRIVWGISALHHDAALCVIRIPEGRLDCDLLYASHAERYSRVKNDLYIHADQVQEAISVAGLPDEVFWHEDPWLKRTRWLKAGQIMAALKEPWPKAYIHGLFKKVSRSRFSSFKPKVTTGLHHKSHLYSVLSTNPYLNEAAYQTPRKLAFDHTLVIDAIGEIQTTTSWLSTSFKKPAQLIYEEPYPRSLGMLYAAVTQHLGLKPMEEEYIVMGMVAYHPGPPNQRAVQLLHNAVSMNLQRGLPEDLASELRTIDDEGPGIAKALQVVVYETMHKLLANQQIHTNIIGLGGGVALNCLNNQALAKDWPDVPLWIYPNAGDAGACVGAVMQHFPKMYLRNWSPYSGTDMGPLGSMAVTEVVDQLLKNKVCGVAHCKAEFGPRALGNRSLLGDPRDPEVKNRVNQYKNRQQFRPLAPMVIEGAHEQYFKIPKNVMESARYMQVTVDVTEEAKRDIPAVVHMDGTARVQLTRPNDPIYQVLSLWYEKTGCPVLLNTSLNVRGEPLVNRHQDAERFAHAVGIPVMTPSGLIEPAF